MHVVAQMENEKQIIPLVAINISFFAYIFRDIY